MGVQLWVVQRWFSKLFIFEARLLSTPCIFWRSKGCKRITIKFYSLLFGSLDIFGALITRTLLAVCFVKTAVCCNILSEEIVSSWFSWIPWEQMRQFSIFRCWIWSHYYHKAHCVIICQLNRNFSLVNKKWLFFIWSIILFLESRVCPMDLRQLFLC